MEQIHGNEHLMIDSDFGDAYVLEVTKILVTETVH